MSKTRSGIWRALLGVTALFALLAATPSLAQSQPSDSLAVNLLNLLVKKGVLTQGDADGLMATAKAQTEQAKAAQAAVPAADRPVATAAPEPAPPAPGVIRIPYVPELVREQIREEVKGDVLKQAKAEGWAQKGAIPDWLGHVTISGDVRAREQADLFSKNNANDVIDYATFNQNGPIDVNPNTNPNGLQVPFLNTRTNRYDLASIRARLAIDAKLSDHVGAGIRVASGDNNGPASTTELLGAGDGKMNVWLDRAFVWLKPTRWSSITLGRMPNPFLSTDVLYSDDLNFDGAALGLNHNLFGDGFKLSLTGGAFPLSYQSFNYPTNSMDKAPARSKWLVAGQLAAQWINSRFEWKVAGAYYDFRNVRGAVSTPCALYTGINQCSTDFSRPEFMQKGNTLFLIRNIQPNPADPQLLTTPLPQFLGLRMGYRLADATTRLDVKVTDTKRLMFTGEYVRNIAYKATDVCRDLPNGLPVNNIIPSALGNQNPCSAPAGDAKAKFQSGPNAWLVKLGFGDPDPSRFGEWNVSVGYRYIQPDALLDAYNSTDFALGGTNAKGYTVTATTGLYRGSYLQFRWFSSNQVYGPPLSVDVGQVELHVRF
jgi:hypothetical protein